MDMQLVGVAEFSNGEKFSIHQFTTSPSCMVTNMRTGNRTRAGSIEKAWSSVRYMARIGQATEHTPGVEQVDYDRLQRELAATRR